MTTEEIIFSLISISIGIVYGVVAQREQFCFSGGIKDLILFKHTRRTASLIIAITTAIVFTQIFSFLYDIDLTQTRYYINANYLFVIAGGIMFGFGMMISDGCSSRHLVKFGQGDIHSFYILISLAIFSYLTYTILAYFPNEIYSSTIISLTQAENAIKMPLYIVALPLLYLLYKNLTKCRNILQTWDGFLIGLLIAVGWYVTTVVADDYFLNQSTQSLSFVYPLGKIIQYILSGFSTKILLFSVLSMIGVIIGAFISSKFNKKYSTKLMCNNSQQNPPKLFEKIVGGAFMGIGGILAIGCTVGQGLSGLSTLSFASLLAIGSIYISAYFTALYMKKKNGLIACFVFDFEEKK